MKNLKDPSKYWSIRSRAKLFQIKFKENNKEKVFETIEYFLKK